MSRLSIRARLTVAFAAALVLVLALAGLFVYLRVEAEMTEAIDDGLRSRAADLAALLPGEEDERPELSGALFEGEDGFSQIVTTDGRVVASTLGSGAGAAIDRETLRRAEDVQVLLGGQEVPGIEGEARVLAAPAGDGRSVVVAGTSTADQKETLAEIGRAFLVGAPLAILLASGLGYLLAARALAPVEAMRKRAAGITLERSDDRLPLPPAEDELHRLGATLNAMLDRLEASLERERVFVADASHELRTPLAVLRTELELAGRPGRSREELEAAVRSAIEEVDRLSRLAEDLLVIARSDQGRLPIKTESVDVPALIARVRERFAGPAGKRGREIVVEAPPGLRAELDPLRIEQAVGNLLENALQHGEGAVQVTVSQQGSLLRIDVSDRGPGFSDGFEEQAFERFSRADEGRTGAGAGLGLAIVRAIALAHGGEASVASNPGDAATVVRITLPLSQSAAEPQ